MQGNRLLSVIAAGGILLTAAVDVCGENQWRTVKGGDRETIDFQNTFDTLYQLTALAASKWKFDGSFEITSGYNGWIKDSDTEEMKSTNAVGALLFSASAFPVKIAGKIVPTEEGNGPPPPTDWSVQGNPKVGTPGISPATAAIAVGDIQQFQYLLDGVPPVTGLDIFWRYSGIDWQKSGSTFTFPLPPYLLSAGKYIVQARIQEGLGDATAEILYVGIRNISGGGVISTTDQPGSNETLVVIKGSDSIEFIAARAPEDCHEWPEGAPVWSPDGSKADSYIFTPSTAGEYLIKASYGTSSKAIKIIVLDVFLSVESYKLGRSSNHLDDKYSNTTITVGTNPQGYEEFITLDASIGTLNVSSDDVTKWTYTSPVENKSDIHLENNGAVIKVYYNQFQYNEDLLLIVYPVFDYLVNNLADYDKAWNYAKWKYNINTSSLSISYDASLPVGSRAETTSWATNFRPKDCRLGPDAFTAGEWGCASVLGHENIHGNQDYSYITLYYAQSEADAYEWELFRSNAPGCTQSPRTYIYDYAKGYYNNAIDQYKKHGGTLVFPK